MAAVLVVACCIIFSLKGTEYKNPKVDTYDLTALQNIAKLIPFKGSVSGKEDIKRTCTICPEDTLAVSGEEENIITQGSKTAVSTNKNY